MLSRTRFTEIVAKNVKKYRTRKGISQEELAARAGFYRSYINLLETARRSPSAYTLHRVANALRVKISELYPTVKELL